MEALNFVAAQEPTAITQAWQAVLEKQLTEQLVREHQLNAGGESSRTARFHSKLQLAAMDNSVLVVEDQPFQQQAINAIMKVYSVKNPSVSFSTHFVESADEALAVLQTRRDFHMVILDVILPDVNGDELLPTIRQLLGDYVAVVMVSAQGDLNLVQHCIFSGADTFIVKPLQIASVAQLWQHCMAKKRQLLSPTSTPAHSFKGGAHSQTQSFKAGTRTEPSTPSSSSRRNDGEGVGVGVPRRATAPQPTAQPMAGSPPRVLSASAPTSPPAIATDGTDPLETNELFGSALASQLHMHAATRSAGTLTGTSHAAKRRADVPKASGVVASDPLPRISSREGRLDQAGLEDLQRAVLTASMADPLAQTVRPPLRDRPASDQMPAPECTISANTTAAGAMPINSAETPRQLPASTFPGRNSSPSTIPEGCRQQ